MLPPASDRGWPAVPDKKTVCRFWARNGLKPNSIARYLEYLGVFFAYCREERLVPTAQLTEESVKDLFRWYVKRTRGKGDRRTLFKRLRSPIRAYAWALSVTGHEIPIWKPLPTKTAPPRIVAEYFAYVRNQRGLARSGLDRDVKELTSFFGFLKSRRCHWRRVRLLDIDQYLFQKTGRYAPATIGRSAYTLRSWLRFLHATGRVSHDLSLTVVSPARRPLYQPPRALPWPLVKKMLRTIDPTTTLGRRDRAQFLLMSAYGLGAAEVLQLRLEDIDWTGRRLLIVRRKTKVPIDLPLLSDVARALADYIRRGRPKPTQSRCVFLSQRMPYRSFDSSGVLRHRVRELARRAGIKAPILGTHLFRHSHATRHVILGTAMKTLGDILGHADSETTSIYTRAAVQHLRRLALPVPL